MKKLLVVALLLGIGVAAWFGWAQYESSKELEAAKSSAKISTVLTTRMLQARESEGEITFGEYFKRGASAIEDMDKEAIGLQTAEWKHRSDARDVTLAFIEACKATLRADAKEMHLLADQQSAKRAADQAWKEFETADSSYGKEYASKRSTTYLTDALSALEKLMEQQKQTDAVVKELLGKDGQLKAVLGPDQGLAKAELDSLSKPQKDAVKP